MRCLFSRFSWYSLFVLIVLCLLPACSTRPVGLLRPNGVAVAPDGSLFVMDRGNYRVVHVAAEGKFLGAFGKLGREANDIYAGWDLALGPDGNLYLGNFVSDEDDNVIHDGVKVFTPEGRQVRELGGKDYAFNEENDSPYGVDVDEQGRVYVAYYRAQTVKVFDAQGEQIAEFFGEVGDQAGQFNNPNDVAVDDRRGLLYVTDQINSRVQQFRLTMTASGELTVTHVLSFGSYGHGPGQFAYLQNIAVDDNTGRVYVGDMANRRIQVFDERGQHVSELAPPVKVWQVMGLNVGSDGAVYAADAFNNAVWVFEPDGQLRGRVEVKP